MMVINFILITIIGTISGCGQTQPEVYPQAIQGTLFEPVKHEGRLATVSDNEVAEQHNYFYLLGASIEIPNNYKVEDKSNEEQINFTLSNEESGAVVHGRSMRPEQAISENFIMLEAVDYVVGEMYGEDDNVQVVDYGAPTRQGSYYYITSYLSDRTILSLISYKGIVVIIDTPNDKAMVDTIINELINPQPEVNENSSLPETYTRLMGGYYYTTKQLGTGKFNIYAIDDKGTTVQIFDGNKEEVLGIFLQQGSFGYTNMTEITLENGYVLYCSKDIAIEKLS